MRDTTPIGATTRGASERPPLPAPPPARSRWVPILMYHSVSDITSKGFAAFAVPPREFAAHIEYLAASGYTTLTLDALARIRLNGGQLPARPVVLTFDDAYADFAGAALPVLQRYGCVASLYVTTGAVGGSNFWVKGDGRRILTWEEAREVAATGVEIGAHSVTHRAMDMLSAQDLQRELVTPKAQLEDHLGQEVTTLAYPFGFESRRVREAAAKAGYRAACSVGYRVSDAAEDPFALSRLIILPGMDARAYARLLTNGSAQWPRRARSLGFRVVRRVAYLIKAVS